MANNDEQLAKKNLNELNFIISILGETNAGKTFLINKITENNYNSGNNN